MFNTQLLHLDVELREAQRRKALSARDFAAEIVRREHHRPSMTHRMATNVLRHLGVALIYLGQRLVQRNALTRHNGAAPL